MKEKVIGVLPAQGYSLLWLDGTTTVPSEPIVGFALWEHADGVQPFPVLTDELISAETTQGYAILYPDGRVCWPGMGTYESLAVFEKELTRLELKSNKGAS